MVAMGGKTGVLMVSSIAIILVILLYTAPGGLVHHTMVSIENSGSLLQTELPLIARTKPRNAVYVVSRSFAGQQGSGALSVSLFQCFLISLLEGSNVLIAEPQEKGSYFNTYAEDHPLDFSSFFDMEYFNEQSRQIGYPEMISLGEFTEQSPSLAVYVYIKNNGRDAVQQVLWEAGGSKDKVNCLENKDTVGTKYGNLDKWNKAHTRKCIVRVVELWNTYIDQWDGKRSTSIDSMNRLIFGDWPPSEVTLIFSFWAFYLYTPLVIPPGGADCMDGFRKGYSKVQFRPSQRLLHDAAKYQDKFLGGKNRLTIMLRVERVVRPVKEEDKKLSALKKCLDEVFKLRSDLAANSRPLVTLDVGSRYGTGSYRRTNNVTKFSREALSSLYNDKWTVNDWDQSFIKAAGGVTDRGYIAALQRVLAGSADCLVLMGGGDFQALAVQDFMNYHGSSNCIHQVCIEYESVQQTIDNFNRHI